MSGNVLQSSWRYFCGKNVKIFFFLFVTFWLFFAQLDRLLSIDLKGWVTTVINGTIEALGMILEDTKALVTWSIIRKLSKKSSINLMFYCSFCILNWPIPRETASGQTILAGLLCFKTSNIVPLANSAKSQQSCFFFAKCWVDSVAPYKDYLSIMIAFCWRSLRWLTGSCFPLAFSKRPFFSRDVAKLSSLKAYIVYWNIGSEFGFAERTFKGLLDGAFWDFFRAWFISWSKNC